MYPIPRNIKGAEADDSRGATEIPSSCTYPLVPLSLGTMRGRLIDLEPLTDRSDDIPSWPLLVLLNGAIATARG